MFAQIGLGVDPTGGIIVLLAGGLLGGLGLVLCAIGAFRVFRAGASRIPSLLLVALGLLLVSPAAWFAWEVFVPDTPRDKSWDFSASRGIAQLKEKKEVGPYYYQGNVRSTTTLDGGRQWSGHADLVVMRTRAGNVTDIRWDSVSDEAGPIYERTRRILGGLGMPDRELGAWYAKVRRGEPASFTAAARPDTGASVEVQVRGSVKEKSWVIHVHVWWNDAK